MFNGWGEGGREGGGALWSNKPGILMLLTNWFKV